MIFCFVLFSALRHTFDIDLHKQLFSLIYQTQKTAFVCVSYLVARKIIGMEMSKMSLDANWKISSRMAEKIRVFFCAYEK